MSAWADSVVQDINSIRVCEEIKEIEAEVQKVLQAQEKALEDMVKNLASYMGLLSIPSPDPISIVKWLKKLVLGTVEPYIEAFESAMKRIEEVAADVEEIAAALSSKISEIEGCATSFDPSSILPSSDLMNSAKSQLSSAQSSISDIKTSVANDESSLNT